MLHKADVDRFYLQRCKGGRGLVGLEDCVQVEAHSLEKYLSTSKEKILKVAVELLNEMSVEEVKKKKHREKV